MRGTRLITAIAAGLATAGLVLAGCASTPTDAASSSQPSFLWTITAEAGVIDGVGNDIGDEPLTMTLIDVRDHATQFTDRPFSDAYVISTADFTARWEQWFADGGVPNAVLSFTLPGDPMPHAIVLRLWEPAYDAAAGTMTFAAQHVHRQPDLHADAIEQIAPPRTAAPERFLSATLFIDSATEAVTDEPAETTDDATSDADAPAAVATDTATDMPDLGASNVKIINGCRIEVGTQCPGVYLQHADLSGANLAGANLSFADLRRANLLDTDLTNSTLIGAQLNQARLFYTDLTEADLTSATVLREGEKDPVRGPDGYSVTMTGVTLTRATLTQAKLIYADLSQALLAGATLNGAELRLTNLRHADLPNADLRGADLSDADLTGANLAGANLQWANLTGTRLEQANLKGANLRSAVLVQAIVRNADLQGADLQGADLTGAQFYNATWVDGRTCAPSGDSGKCN